MENVVKRPRISVFLIILVFLLVLAIAAGVYFIFGGGSKKEPRRGTYVMCVCDENENIFKHICYENETFSSSAMKMKTFSSIGGDKT